MKLTTTLLILNFFFSFMVKNVIIIGPQASGKGTQAEKIAEQYNLRNFSMGDALREEKKSGSELGKEIGALIDQGKMVPDEITYKIIDKTVAQDGYILDGFPRNLTQAEYLDSKTNIDTVVVLEVPDETCIKRISGRRICETCQAGYHVDFKPPKSEGICDIDGGKLVMRADDEPKAVEDRLKTYHEKTTPVIEHYSQKEGVTVYKINGTPNISEVTKLIMDALKE